MILDSNSVKNIDQYIDQFMTMLVAYAPKFVFAVITFIIGLILIKIFRRFMTRLMAKDKADPTVLKFMMDLLTWIFRILLAMSVIEKLGIATTSFVAIIGAAGLAVGLSLQGSLSNFAGGILIIMFKPFRVGDYIEAQNQAGTVNSIQIFSTKLITSNNQVVYLPNGALSNGTIKNFSQEPLRRAEIILSVAYSTNLKFVKDTLQQIIQSDSKILNEPAPGIEIKALAENSINIAVTIWSQRAYYGAMVSDFYENTKEAFEKANIEIPHPQRDIHLKKDIV